MTIRSHPGTYVIHGSQPNVHGTGPKYSRTYDISEIYVGDDNPQWLKAVKAGLNATNPLNARRAFCDFQPMDMRGTIWFTPTVQSGKYADGHTGYPSGLQADVEPPNMPLYVGHSSTALADCVAQFNHKLQDEMRPVQGLVFLGELGETIRMIKQAGRRLTTHVGDYVREARRYLKSDHRRRKALKSLSDLWLEHAFGWTPLFLDIAAGVKSLSVPRSVRTMIRAWGEDRSVDARQRAEPCLIGSLRALECDCFFRNTNVSSAQQVACLDMSLVGQPSPAVADSFKSVADRWGLTARDFIPAAWELIPYSFLVGYYTNIGDVIDSAFADRRAIAWAYQTQRTTIIRETRWSNCRPIKNSGNRYYALVTSNTPGRITVGAKQFTRQVVLVAIPPISIGYPDFGGKQYANQMALILGRLRTR